MLLGTSPELIVFSGKMGTIICKCRVYLLGYGNVIFESNPSQNGCFPFGFTLKLVLKIVLLPRG